MNAIDQLWKATRRGRPIDARRLFDALSAVQPSDVEAADERSRMLVRDARDALTNFRGSERDYAGGVARLPSFAPPSDDSGDCGFPSIGLRLMEPTDPAVLFDILRELSRLVHRPCKLVIGGSLALMLDELIVRPTDDVDVVDELPAEIREQHDLLRELTSRFGLKLAHFQSHYLPDGWHRRTRSLGVFGSITAYRIDPLDVLVGKLFSKRTKDRDDIRHALPLIDRPSFEDRIATSTARWRAIDEMLQIATDNWYVLTGNESLPPAK